MQMLQVFGFPGDELNNEALQLPSNVYALDWRRGVVKKEYI